LLLFWFIEAGRSLDFMYAVYAGLEPEGFIELFPYWVVQEDITDLQLDVSFFKLFLKLNMEKFRGILKEAYKLMYVILCCINVFF